MSLTSRQIENKNSKKPTQRCPAGPEKDMGVVRPGFLTPRPGRIPENMALSPREDSLLKQSAEIKDARDGIELTPRTQDYIFELGANSRERTFITITERGAVRELRIATPDTYREQFDRSCGIWHEVKYNPESKIIIGKLGSISSIINPHTGARHIRNSISALS